MPSKRKYQTADHAHTGPGQRSNFSPTAPSAPSPSPSANNPSGSSQGNKRGKQG